MNILIWENRITDSNMIWNIMCDIELLLLYICLYVMDIFSPIVSLDALASLTQWGRDEINDILQTTFSNASF